MARQRSVNDAEVAAVEDEFPEDGVLLYDRSGREYTAGTRVEYTSLLYGQGYSTEKPKDPEPEPVVPTP